MSGIYGNYIPELESSNVFDINFCDSDTVSGRFRFVGNCGLCYLCFLISGLPVK